MEHIKLKHLRLGVNIDHVATLRNARGGSHPSPVAAALLAQKAGADGIMIHSRHKDPAEIIEFMQKFRASDRHTPIVVVPTSFNSVTVEEFAEMGVNIVITANHMLRSAYPAMLKVAKSILSYGRSLEAEPDCMSIKEILEFIPGTK